MVKAIDLLGSDTDGTTDLFSAFPWVRHVIPEWSGWNKAMRVLNTVMGFLRPIIKDHVDRHDPDQEPTDYIDVYLNNVSGVLTLLVEF